MADVVVLDNGSAFSKAGVAGDDAPRSVIPAIISQENNSEYLFGFEAENSKKQIHHPITKRKITDLDLMEKIWNYTFCQELDVPPGEFALLFAEAPLTEKALKEKIGESFFEKFQVPGLCFALQPLLTLYCTGRTTGVVVDIGENISHVVPVIGGSWEDQTIATMEMGGGDLTTYMKSLLAERGYSFSSSNERDILADIKQKTCRIAPNIEAELLKPAQELSQSYELPDGSTIPIGSERFKAPEALFQPSLLGIESQGLHMLVADMITKTNVEKARRGELYKNIVLAGGTSLLEGLADRLNNEMKKLAPGEFTTRVVASPERRFATWIGGSIVASLASAFNNLQVCKSEYEEQGPAVLHRNRFAL